MTHDERASVHSTASLTEALAAAVSTAAVHAPGGRGGAEPEPGPEELIQRSAEVRGERRRRRHDRPARARRDHQGPGHAAWGGRFGQLKVIKADVEVLKPRYASPSGLRALARAMVTGDGYARGLRVRR